MTRPMLFVALCAVLALVAGPTPAAAQKSDRPPKELWDPFPLEPSATPARADPKPGPLRVVHVPKSDGLSQTALAALMVAAAGLGALTAAAIRPRYRCGSPAFAHGAAKPAAVKRARVAEPAPRPTPSVQPPSAPPSPPTIPPQPKARRFAASPPASTTCRIELHNSSIRPHFYAVPSPGGPVIARSPYFRIGHTEGGPGLSAPEALRALVEHLTAAGWRQTGAGRTPWDLQFDRRAEAPRPLAPSR